MIPGTWDEETMITTSHVGSVPLPFSIKNVEKAFNDMVAIGIKAPPYPQLRDFIDVFLDPLKNQGVLRNTRNGYYILLEEPDKYSIKLPVEAEMIIKKLRPKSLRYLRAPITGPFTLASRILLSEDSYSLSNTVVASKDIMMGFIAQYVAGYARMLSRIGYNFIVVDDPMLANIVGRRVILFNYKVDDIIEIYDTIFKGIESSGINGIHVCGELSPMVPEILSSVERIHVLNHEFKDSPRNLEINWKKILVESGKMLAPGILSSKKPTVETVDETIILLKKIAENAGFDNIDFVSADCGFMALTAETSDVLEAYDIAKKKWRVLVAAAERFSRHHASLIQ